MKMGAVTYPDSDVVDLMNTRFVAYKRSMDESPGPDALPLLRGVRVLWTPDFLFLDPRGVPIRRRIGYAPPDEFVGELRFVLGLVAMVHREFANAVEEFERAAGPGRERGIAAEALYWKGVAAYKLGRDRAILRRHWDEIRERFGTTDWWTRAEASYGEP